MTVAELVRELRKKLAAGMISDDAEVQVRNPQVSESAMEAGSYGYVDLDMIVADTDGTLKLIGEEE